MKQNRYNELKNVDREVDSNIYTEGGDDVLHKNGLVSLHIHVRLRKPQ